MNVPHKHEAIIKAWAEGYEIEAFNPEWGQWVTVPEPGWFNDIEYRVKPGVIEPRMPKYDEYVVRIDQDPFNEDNLDITNECSEYEHYNLKLLYEDGKLIRAEVMDEESPW